MTGIFPIAFFDAPRVLDASVTPIPGSGSSPLQVVADLGAVACYGIQYIDSTGDYIGIYQGPVGAERLICVVGGGTVGYVQGVITARTRISVRSMTTSAITNGSLFCTFLGAGLR